MVQMTLPALKPTGFESDYEDLAAQLKRRRLQAAALSNQDLGLGAQMVSGRKRTVYGSDKCAPMAYTMAPQRFTGITRYWACTVE